MPTLAVVYIENEKYSSEGNKIMSKLISRWKSDKIFTKFSYVWL